MATPRTCQNCNGLITGRAGKIFCGQKCKAAGFKERHAAPLDDEDSDEELEAAQDDAAEELEFNSQPTRYYLERESAELRQKLDKRYGDIVDRFLDFEDQVLAITEFKDLLYDVNRLSTDYRSHPAITRAEAKLRLNDLLDIRALLREIGSGKDPDPSAPKGFDVFSIKRKWREALRDRMVEPV